MILGTISLFDNYFNVVVVQLIQVHIFIQVFNI